MFTLDELVGLAVGVIETVAVPVIAMDVLGVGLFEAVMVALLGLKQVTEGVTVSVREEDIEGVELLKAVPVAVKLLDGIGNFVADSEGVIDCVYVQLGVLVLVRVKACVPVTAILPFG
eukprot:gb/GECG01006926.1/.p1 GENE.gb/GECG01006926.1/~~gb/GECG01006926.1/.p1  ORF type:complete len:118 (+),score=16.84 gb/GECG01006926.1/:1-354(+)